MNSGLIGASLGPDTQRSGGTGLRRESSRLTASFFLSSGATEVVFDSVVWDDLGVFSYNRQSTLVVRAGGIYRVTARLQILGLGDERENDTHVQVNNNYKEIVRQSAAFLATITSNTVVCTELMLPGDYFVVTAYQDGAGSIGAGVYVDVELIG